VLGEADGPEERVGLSESIIGLVVGRGEPLGSNDTDGIIETLGIADGLVEGAPLTDGSWLTDGISLGLALTDGS